MKKSSSFVHVEKRGEAVQLVKSKINLLEKIIVFRVIIDLLLFSGWREKKREGEEDLKS